MQGTFITEKIFIHFSVLYYIFFFIHLNISFRIVAWKMKNLNKASFLSFSLRNKLWKKLTKQLKIWMKMLILQQNLEVLLLRNPMVNRIIIGSSKGLDKHRSDIETSKCRPIQHCTNPGCQVVHWRLIFMGPQQGTGLTSPSWRLQFWSGSYIFRKCLHHCTF